MSTTLFVTLNHIECANCGVIFGITPDYQQRRRDDHQSFMCPAGHANVYNQKSDAEKLRDEVARLQTSIEHKDAHAAYLRESNSKLTRKCSAVRGVVTRIKNRVQHGVCPCCNRTFQNLARHMESEHPTFAAPEAL